MVSVIATVYPQVVHRFVVLPNELAKETPGRLLASEAIVNRAGASEAPQWRLGDSVTLRGRSRPTRLATAPSA